MDNFDLWLKECKVNNTKIFPLEGEGKTAFYKCWSEHLVKHNYIRDTPVYIGWVDGKQVCAFTNYKVLCLVGKTKKKGGGQMADEKLFENRIKKYFHSVGIYPAGYPSDRMDAPMVGWYTKIWGGGFQKSGIPDLICCVNGIMLAVEVKASNGRPSELQKLNISRINKSGGIGVFLYPEGFEQFKKFLEEVIDCNIHIQELIVLKNANLSTKCDIWKG